jgi:hypothetical protein
VRKEGLAIRGRRFLNNTKAFTRAYHKSGHRLSESEIRAEAHKRQKEMRGADRAAEMPEEEVVLEKLKGLAEKEAARKAATRQAGTAKRAAEKAKRWAATGRADKDKHAAVEARRWAATGQADTQSTRLCILQFSGRQILSSRLRATSPAASQIQQRPIFFRRNKLGSLLRAT